MFLFSIPEEPAPQRGQAEYLEKYISGISEGDKEALAGLYESTHAAVYGFALSLCKNTHDAEDVLQDVFLQIWNAAGQYTAAGKPDGVDFHDHTESFPAEPQAQGKSRSASGGRAAGAVRRSSAPHKRGQDRPGIASEYARRRRTADRGITCAVGNEAQRNRVAFAPSASNCSVQIPPCDQKARQYRKGGRFPMKQKEVEQRVRVAVEHAAPG